MLFRTRHFLWNAYQCKSKNCISVITKNSYSSIQQTEETLETVTNTENKDLNESKSTKMASVKKLPFKHTALSKIMLNVKSRKTRAKSNLMYFEGKRILQEALDAGIHPLKVFFARKNEIEGINFPPDTELLKMPYDELKVWSDLVTPPGVIAICKRPKIMAQNPGDLPVTVICDNLREPGNLGALIRSSVGAGVKEIILTKGCVDAWDPKVIRGSAGTQFWIALHSNVVWEDMKNYLTDDTHLFMATNKNHMEVTDFVIPYFEPNYCDYKSMALIIGGETEGISKEAHKFIKLYKHHMITIPLSNKTESLNSMSALSIVLFEIKRQVLFNK